jgi:uncharacterized membrane protein HdeD (DUF308 family)
VANLNSPVVRPDVGDEEIQEIASLWWLLLLAGVASLVVGALLLAWPSRTFEVIAILLGIELLVSGGLQIGLAFGERSGSRTGSLVLGAVAGVAGLIVIRHPGGSLLLVALAVGIFLVLSGVLRLVSAFESTEGRGWMLLGAVVDLAIGVLIVAWPKFGVNSLAVLVGIALVVRGMLEAASALTLRSVSKLSI